LDLEIKAPFDGLVSSLSVRIGELVTAGTPIIMLAGGNSLQVETTDLNEIDVARLKVGDQATVTFDALPGINVDGTVSKIALKSSSGSGVNYTIVIKPDTIPEGLLWGMTAFVDIRVEE
jgi:HlyD family secretion protein